MKKLVSLIIACLAFSMLLCLQACNSANVESFEINKESLEIYSGKNSSVYYNIVSDSKDVTFTVSSTNEEVAYAQVYKDYDYFKVTAKNPGTCSIIVEAGGKSDSIDVLVLFDPDISVYEGENNAFTIFTEFPKNTKLNVSLLGDGYFEEQTVTLIENNVSESEAVVYFNNKEETLNGKYSLKIELEDMTVQPQELKALIGENKEFIKQEDSFYEREYNLPYKTLTEIIRETDYKDLTVSQQMTIIRWIDRRFEYYDDLQGSYQGLKWKGVIFNEAAEEFNKTYNEVHTIYYGYC